MNPYVNLGRVGVFIPRADSLSVLCSGMDLGTVRTILAKAISSPAEVDLPKLDEAIQWVEDRGTIRRLDSPQFDAAAVELCVLRRLFAYRQLAGVKTSAQRVLMLLQRSAPAKMRLSRRAMTIVP